METIKDEDESQFIDVKKEEIWKGTDIENNQG